MFQTRSINPPPPRRSFVTGNLQCEPKLLGTKKKENPLGFFLLLVNMFAGTQHMQHARTNASMLAETQTLVIASAAGTHALGRATTNPPASACGGRISHEGYVAPSRWRCITTAAPGFETPHSETSWRAVRLHEAKSVFCRFHDFCRELKRGRMGWERRGGFRRSDWPNV